MKTFYSFRAATGSPEDVVARMKELGFEYAPIDDIGSTFGWSKWQKACETHGLKPVYGVSLLVTELIQAKKVTTDLFSFYAIDDIEPLNALVNKAYKQGRSLPRLGFTPLLKYSDLPNLGNVIIVSGYKARLGLMDAEQPNLYVGMSPASTKGFLDQAVSEGFKLFSRQEQRFVNKEDRPFYEMATGFYADLHNYPQYILSGEEWRSSCYLGHEAYGNWATTNAMKAFSECTATLRKGTLIKPPVEKTLEEMCRDGIARLKLSWSDEYEERLQTELKVIAEKEFEDYFFLVSDFMLWARENMMVGPGRGSSAGSLVCYLLGITHVDPIKYGLLFFRFLDPSRPDWPDIDSDVSRRDEAVEYLINKYGERRVAKLGTVGTFQASSSKNEVVKLLDLPKFEFNGIVDSLPDYAAGDRRKDRALEIALNETEEGKKLLAKYPNFIHAGKLSGTPQNAGTHASGVILTEDDLARYVAVNANTGSTMCDLREAEARNLLKLDVLGLETLNIFENTLKMAGLPRDFLDTIPLDDQAAFDILNDGKFTGLFQYDGAALRYLTSQIKVDCFDDIAVISALARPGALASGAADAWARRKMGREAVSYPHPLLEPYLKETLGAMAYQETIMLVAREVAGMDWGAVSKLRKAIGKSMGPEAMREYGDPFKNGLLAKGIPQEVADKFWSDILGAGSYMFNKSHSVAYGFVSYQSCYLKAHFPIEFTAASLSSTDSLSKQIAFLREMQKEGVGYVPFDRDQSIDRWSVMHKDGNKFLLGPLQNVKGLGPKKVQQVLACRARNEPLPEALSKMLESPKTDFDSLTPIRDAIAKMNWRAHCNGPVTRLDQATPTDGWQDYTVIGLVSKCEEQSENDERKVADRLSRGEQGILPGDPKSIQIRLDSDEVVGYLCKVSARKFDDFKDAILGKIEAGKSIVAISGSCVPGIPCLMIKSISEIGRIE